MTSKPHSKTAEQITTNRPTKISTADHSKPQTTMKEYTDSPETSQTHHFRSTTKTASHPTQMPASSTRSHQTEKKGESKGHKTVGSKKCESMFY